MILTRPAAVLAAPLFLLLSLPVAGQEGQLDGSPTIFTVLAAINAAGYDADLDSAANHPLRMEIRQALAKKDIPSLGDLKRFFAAHAQKDGNAELNQYISFALSVDSPPDFRYRFKPNEIPPDAQQLDGLQDLLVRFYKEADIETLWRKAQPAYEQVIASYQMPVTQAVMEANAFLRNPTSGYLGRRFQIYVDLLGAPNQIQTRSYKDDYFVVLTPTPDPQVGEIRHAYLHYLLDPLSFKYAAGVFEKRALIDYAQAAPALEQYYKDDISLLMTESLIKAIEARLTRGGPAKQQAVVEQALREGFVITPALYEGLAGYEKQERALRLYYPDLIQSIDLKKEGRRLANVEFARERATRSVRVTPAERKVEAKGAYKTLEDAQALYEGRRLDAARDMYLRALKETAEKPLHARAYYGLARVAALNHDGDAAQQFFRKALENDPDAETRSWSLIYLGRIADAHGEREEAANHYKNALEVQGASERARKAAEQGLKESFRKPQ